MYLFAEEDFLARKADLKKLRMIYHSSLRVDHKEDGSMKFLSQDLLKIQLRSLRTLYYEEIES
ncbi:hypothetical protein D3C76_1059160 [compost metagenome]